MTATEHRTRDALVQARDAKEDAVHTHGIGTDLAPTVYGWSTEGHGIAILTTPTTTPADELHHVTAAVMAFADGMGIHTATVIKEGYAAAKDTVHDPRPLAQRFAQGDKTVHECITAVTVHVDGDTTFAIHPYTVGLGRKVAWHDDMDIVNIRHTDLPLAAALHQALEPDGVTGIEHALEVLDTLGFAALWHHRR